MDNQYYTYLYKDTDGTPIYIGKGHGDRAWLHFGFKSHLGNLLRKRKKSGFIAPELTYHKNELTALAMEIFWISIYGRKDKNLGTLLNRTDGGDGTSGKIVSQETRAKLSIIKKGQIPWNIDKGKYIGIVSRISDRKELTPQQFDSYIQYENRKLRNLINNF